MRGDVDKKIRSMTSPGKVVIRHKIISAQRTDQDTKPEETKIQVIRSELKNLRKRYKEAPEEERLALSELRLYNQEKLKSLGVQKITDGTGV